MNDNNKPTYIYVLIDPRNGEIRYVGQTIQLLQQRFNEHISDKRHNKRTSWIKSLVKQGLRPIMEVIETVPAGEDWKAREMYQIKRHRDMGCNLVNATDGGEGARGWKPSPEQIEKHRQKMLGKKMPQSQKHRENIRQGLLGTKHTPETRVNMSKSHMKPVAQYMLDGVTLIRVWESATTAERELGFCKASIGQCAREECSSALGFIWKYVIIE